MRFYSTNNKDHKVGLREAVVRGLAPDTGLYMPERIPALPQEFITALHGLSFRDIAFTVAKHLLGDDVPEQELRRITDQTISFEAPLVQVEEHVHSLELFHGPTMAFKDFGAKFMSQLLGYFAQQQDQEIVILVATSGDTGSAVANGFLGVKGTRVIVLYPSGKVSEVQEKQFTTLGQNVTALEVDGTFDDCQRLVKQAFQDEELRSEFFLTSANSINIARLIPQSFYYFQAFAQLKDSARRQVVISVPSGNFGNLTGGLLAKRMGLPVQQFIVSTNINDVIPEYFKTRSFEPKASKQTISNAMDVGNPSNFARMIDLYGHNFEALVKDVSGYAFTDLETRNAMQKVYAEKKYVLDPHGAVGYLGLKKYLSMNSGATGIFLETAHPGKFLEVVEQALNQKITLPAALNKFMSGNKSTVPVANNFKDFKNTLRRL